MQERCCKMIFIDQDLLNKVSVDAKSSPRLRMNYNFHQSLEDKCHRFLNAVEPGTEVPIGRLYGYSVNDKNRSKWHSLLK